MRLYGWLLKGCRRVDTAARPTRSNVTVHGAEKAVRIEPWLRENCSAMQSPKQGTRGVPQLPLDYLRLPSNDGSANDGAFRPTSRSRKLYGLVRFSEPIRCILVGKVSEIKYCTVTSFLKKVELILSWTKSPSPGFLDSALEKSVAIFSSETETLLKSATHPYGRCRRNVYLVEAPGGVLPSRLVSWAQKYIGTASCRPYLLPFNAFAV